MFDVPSSITIVMCRSPFVPMTAGWHVPSEIQNSLGYHACRFGQACERWVAQVGVIAYLWPKAKRLSRNKPLDLLPSPGCVAPVASPTSQPWDGYRSRTHVCPKRQAYHPLSERLFTSGQTRHPVDHFENSLLDTSYGNGDSLSILLSHLISRQFGTRPICCISSSKTIPSLLLTDSECRQTVSHS
jgi:hypothetical protein